MTVRIRRMASSFMPVLWLALVIGCGNTAGYPSSDSTAPPMMSGSTTSSVSLDPRANPVSISRYAEQAPETQGVWECFSYNFTKHAPPTVASWPWRWEGSACFIGGRCPSQREEIIQRTAARLELSSTRVQQLVSNCTSVKQPHCYAAVLGTSIDILAHKGKFCSATSEDCITAMALDARAPLTGCIDADVVEKKGRQHQIVSCTNLRDGKRGKVCGIGLDHCVRDAEISKWQTSTGLGNCEPNDRTNVWCGVVTLQGWESQPGPESRRIDSLVCSDGYDECLVRMQLSGGKRVADCVQLERKL